ncbi:MAG: heme o synthase [Vicinamibacteraceae bacterium]|nr:heme o synthase [Vicinamibacteraceae bacterium]
MLKSHAAAMVVDRSRVADYVALTKPRLNTLVVATSAAGFYLGSIGDFDALRFVNTVVGTACVAGAGAALNQVYERRTDALMTRTRYRPLPDGRLQPAEASRFALVLAVAGMTLLAWGANLVAAFIALATLVTYTAVYTPLKTRTSFNTVIGAVPGALPAVIGWTGATGVVSREALLLFAIVFLWQMPHFLAIAWMYRDDYAAAGLAMLPVVEPDGHSTSRQALAYAAALVPVSLAPAALGMASAAYFVGALLLGLAFLWCAVRFARTRHMLDARRLFFASITYLPLVWGLMIATRT